MRRSAGNFARSIDARTIALSGLILLVWLSHLTLPTGTLNQLQNGFDSSEVNEPVDTGNSY